MKRIHDKYGRGSAAANGIGFVDLEPGDTFSGLEVKLRLVQSVVYENKMLNLKASIASRRNANELSKHMAPGEEEEAHKFAAKNVGVLFSHGRVGICHFDKKAIRDDSPKPVMLRVFSTFFFAGERMVATITLRQERDGNKLYAIEALETNEDANSERTPRGGTAPLQNLASQLMNRIAYYVGDVNRTRPSFVASEEQFSVERAASEILKMNGGQTMAKTDISVIILIGQEKIHLQRCVEKMAALNPRQIFLVESQPDDGGVAIAKETAAKLGLRLETMSHKWPGLYAEQFNWALENLPIEAEWVIRLDADEYFLPEAIDELKEKLPKLPKDVTGVINKRRHYIFGGWAKHGTYPVKLLRVFRRRMAFCEERYMDEHMQLREGRAVEFDCDFVDHNLNSFEWWQEKHRGYAKREAMDAMEIMAEIRSGKEKGIKIDGQAAGKRAKKYKYYQLPRYFRAVLYFCLRYFVKGGFLDGRAGWMWNFWQGLWYRWIVDREIGRMRRG